LSVSRLAHWGRTAAAAATHRPAAAPQPVGPLPQRRLVTAAARKETGGKEII